MGKRHHCRRCGNTFCADCSTKRAPERVCDDCYPTALKEYDFLTRQIPEHLDAGEVVARRISGTILFGKKTETVLVRLNVAGDGLEISNTTIRLASIVEVEDPLTIKTDQSAVRLEGATPRFVEAVKAAVYFSKAPDLALAVDQQRQAIKLKKQREEAVRRREAALAQRRADNANLRNNLKQKYSLK